MRFSQTRISPSSGLFRLLSLLLLALPCAAQPAYRTSQAAFLGAHALDVHSSWGKPEANPMLGDRFAWRAVAVKSAVATGMIYAQERSPRKWRRYWIVANFAAAGVISAVAVRNYGVQRRSVTAAQTPRP